MSGNSHLWFSILQPPGASTVVKFWETQQLHVDFWLCGGSVPLTPAMFKGPLCMQYSFPSVRQVNYCSILSWRKNNWTELKQHTTVLTRVQQFWFAYNTSLLSPHTLLLSGHTRNSHFHVLWSFLYHSGKVLKVEAEEINTVLLLFLKFTFFQLPSGIGHHSFTLK